MQKFIFYTGMLLMLYSFKKDNAANLYVEEMNWQQLSRVTFKDTWTDTYKMKTERAIFDTSIKKMRGKTISIAGFLIPTTTYGNEYVLSENPYSGCYFCGNAGIESVIELKFKGNDIRYKLDRFIKVEGILALNELNTIDFIYVLHNAKEIK